MQTFHFLRQKSYVLSQATFYLLAFLATLAVCGHPFFWDTIQLGAKHANYFYFSDFQSLILPAELDSGHPPTFGLYLASVWTVLNRSLPISHFAMLPFLWGIIFFLFKIGKQLAGKKAAPWLVLLCFADPVLATQCTLVSPDVVLACFFLMAVWAILACGHTPGSTWSADGGRSDIKYDASINLNLSGAKVWLALAITGLALVSMRGMMLCAGLYLFSLCLKLGGNLKFPPKLSFGMLLNTFWPFLPGALLAGAFLFYHWQQTGWVAYHAASTWAPSFERVDIQGFAKNLAVLAWRLCDFGRVFVWACLAALLLFFWRKKAAWKELREGRKLLCLLGLVFVAIVPTQLLYKGLLAHRYLLPVFLCLNLLLFYCLFKASIAIRLRNALYALALVGLLTGNLWNYPDKISMGWDSTLAHLPWYELRGQMDSHITHNMRMHEQRHQIGTAFPNLASQHHSILLMADDGGFAEKDFSQNCYIFWSNIMNDFTDAELEELRSEWKVLKHLQKGQVEVILYQNPHLKCEN